MSLNFRVAIEVQSFDDDGKPIPEWAIYRATGETMDLLTLKYEEECDDLGRVKPTVSKPLPVEPTLKQVVDGLYGRRTFWRCAYGDCVGTGSSPAQAYAEFVRKWTHSNEDDE